MLLREKISLLCLIIMSIGPSGGLEEELEWEGGRYIEVTTQVAATCTLFTVIESLFS